LYDKARYCACAEKHLTNSTWTYVILKFVGLVLNEMYMHNLGRRALLAILCSMLVHTMKAQSVALAPADLKAIQYMEDSLAVTADSMYGGFLSDVRLVYSERFARQLVRALKIPGSWTYGFPKLTNKINIVYPEDKAFRIFNWDIAPTEDTRRYYGAIQMPMQELKLYGLVDYSTQLGKGAEDSVLSRGRWLGALYYRIIQNDIDGKRYYTLFGLNAAGRLSNKMVLDPLTFDATGPVFGAPIFNVRSENLPNERVQRFILEYKKDVQVAMNWNAELSAIYFDELVSQVNDPARKYTYVPSGQINGFKWDGAHWNFMQNIVPIVPRKDGQAPIGEER
jgi:hypothetical protein